MNPPLHQSSFSGISMDQKVVNNRVYITGIICLVIALLFIFKLFNLHFFSKINIPQQQKSHIKRGAIKDKNGYILATSIELNSLFGNPEEIKNPEKVASLIAPLLNVSQERIRKRLSQKNRRFVWIKRKLDNKKAKEIRSLKIKGLHFRKEYKRVYPHKSLASNLIGFVGVDNTGLEGLEYKYNGILSGEENLNGDEEEAIDTGTSITLTIDRYIQSLAEEAIERTVKNHNATQGAVVVFEVKTGRVLSLARFPHYDPNLYFQFPAFDRRNFTIIDHFEPGSTLKIISLAALLEFYPAIMNKTFTCEGSIDIADHTVNCTGVHGSVMMPDIIGYSCNVGVIQAMRRLRTRNFHDVLLRFGFGRRTGSELPGEVGGILRPVSQWSGLSRYSIAIGHEISVTSLQMVGAFGAIANDGVYMVPSFIENVRNPDGTFAYQFSPRTRGRIISRDIAAVLMRMMRGVVANGTGRRAGSRFFLVVGKTGTSRKFIAGVYSDRVVSSFIGIAPYEDPEVCILIVIDDPGDRLSGGQIAAPVFAQIIDRVLTRMGVRSRTIPGGHPVLRMPDRKVFSGTTMPDFSNMNISEAAAILAEMDRQIGVDYTISGTGRVYSQEPVSGNRLSRGNRIVLYMSED